MSPESSTDNLEVSTGASKAATKTLPELYNQGLDCMKKAETLARGDQRQSSYIKAYLSFKEAKDLVDSLSLFSDNETVDDIPTVDLRYLLIPAYMAKILISKECQHDRLETLTQAESLAKEFLVLVLKYGLGDSEELERIMNPESVDNSSTEASLESAMQARTKKIEKFKQRKMLTDKIDEFKSQLKDNRLDEEVMRDYYLCLLKKSIDDTGESLLQEIRPAIFFERIRASSSLSRIDDAITDRKHHPALLQKPLTLVKNELQKKVFGIGYPSRPTVTVDEFIGKKLQDGSLAFEAHKDVYSNSLQRYAEQPNLMRDQEETEEIEREEKDESEDIDELERKRRWDEFKDENQRGSGNRHNMG